MRFSLPRLFSRTKAQKSSPGEVPVDVRYVDLAISNAAILITAISSKKLLDLKRAIEEENDQPDFLKGGDGDENSAVEALNWESAHGMAFSRELNFLYNMYHEGSAELNAQVADALDIVLRELKRSGAEIAKTEFAVEASERNIGQIRRARDACRANTVIKSAYPAPFFGIGLTKIFLAFIFISFTIDGIKLFLIQLAAAFGGAGK